MQAEVTGKLKQHFNNALPKQNSTTTGVSIIMVSRTGGSALGQLQRLAHCSSTSYQVSRQALPSRGRGRCRVPLHFRNGLAREGHPLAGSQALGPGIRGCAGPSKARLMGPWPGHPSLFSWAWWPPGSCFCLIPAFPSRQRFPSPGGPYSKRR